MHIDIQKQWSGPVLGRMNIAVLYLHGLTNLYSISYFFWNKLSWISQNYFDPSWLKLSAKGAIYKSQILQFRSWLDFFLLKHILHCKIYISKCDELTVYFQYSFVNMQYIHWTCSLRDRPLNLQEGVHRRCYILFSYIKNTMTSTLHFDVKC